MLVAMGHSVSGSDLQSSPVLERLDSLGIRTFIGHDPSNVGEAEIVAFSTAVSASNVELVEARRRGIPTLTRAEVLAAICRTRRTLAVSGTHGKTTTTAMLAAVLVAGRASSPVSLWAASCPVGAEARAGGAANGSWSRPTSPTGPFSAWAQKASSSPTSRSTTWTTTATRLPSPARSRGLWSRRRARESCASTTRAHRHLRGPSLGSSPMAASSAPTTGSPPSSFRHREQASS